MKFFSLPRAFSWNGKAIAATLMFRDRPFNITPFVGVKLAACKSTPKRAVWIVLWRSYLWSGLLRQQWSPSPCHNAQTFSISSFLTGAGYGLARVLRLCQCVFTAVQTDTISWLPRRPVSSSEACISFFIFVHKCCHCCGEGVATGLAGLLKENIE